MSGNGIRPAVASSGATAGPVMPGPDPCPTPPEAPGNGIGSSTGNGAAGSTAATAAAPPLSLSRSFAAVTTCHAEGYAQYGREMVEGFLRHWPAAVTLYLYAEGFRPDIVDPRLVVLDLLGECPALVAFKERHRGNRRAHGELARRRWEVKVRLRRPTFRVRKVDDWGLGFRWNAVRFSHKAFSIFAAAKRCGTDVLFWVDADTRIFADVPIAFLEGLMPPDCLVSYLNRPRYSECGFVGYNLRHPATAGFLADFERLYTEDTLFNLPEYHDSYLFDIIRRRYRRRGFAAYDIGEGIGAGGGHVFVNSKLGQFMDHMKGERKSEGRSRDSDLCVTRAESYWQDSA
jgi:hypothetical protein